SIDDELTANCLSATAGTKSDTISVSPNAAGWGWYLNPDPLDGNYIDTLYGESAASATPGSAAVGKIDLLTTLLEQLGFIAGVKGDGSDDDLMNPELPIGVRRLIGPADIPDPNSPPPKIKIPNAVVGKLLANDPPNYSRLVSAAPNTPSADTL